MTSSTEQREEPTAIGILVFLAVGISMLTLSIWAANRLYLIYHYGWRRFSAEALIFIQTPKGQPWIVSNGDKLDVGFGHYLVSCAIWLPLFFLVFYLAMRLLGRDRIFRLHRP